MGKLFTLPLLTVAILAIGLGIKIPVANAQVSGTENLDLIRLVTAVIERNEGLTARQLQAKARQELVTSAGALDDPRLSYAIAPSSIGDDIPSDFGNALRVRQVFQISQSIPWPGKLDLRTEEAAAQAEVVGYSYDTLLLDLVSQSRMLWAELWYAKQALATNTTHQQLVSDLENIVSTQYANGLGLQQDVLGTQTALVRLTHQQRVLEQEQRRIQARINGLLNQPATPIWVRRANNFRSRKSPISPNCATGCWLNNLNCWHWKPRPLPRIHALHWQKKRIIRICNLTWGITNS